MSFQAQQWAIENSEHKGAALLVLLMIAYHAHDDGSNAFPSVATLAKECRMSERQITRIIQKLEASGEIILDRSSGRRSHRYRVVMSAAVEGQAYADNPDIVMSGLSDTVGSDLSPSTLTNRARNPDKSDANPDIVMSPELTIELKKNLNKNTHTPRASATPTQSANAGVCVTSLKSQFSFEQRKAYAAANKLLGGWLSLSKDGRDDEQIADWLAASTPESVEAKRAAPPQTRQTEGQVLDLLRSMLSRFPSYDVAGYIAQLTDFDEQAKARLLAKFPSVPATAPLTHAGLACVQGGAMS